MKLSLSTKLFLKSWTLAEKVAAKQSPQPTLSSVHFKADESGLTLESTDLKLSVSKMAEGVTILEPGHALLPISPLGELLKKIDSDTVTITVPEGDTQGTLQAGDNTYHLPLFDVNLFPDLPNNAQKTLFARLSSSELTRLFDEGIVAANATNDYPLYQSATYLEIIDGVLHVVSTDGRRLSLSKTDVGAKENKSVLLPFDAVKEYSRFLAGEPEEEVEIYCDETSLVWFDTPGTQYSVRRVDSNFPNYQRLLQSNVTTTLDVDRVAFINALERVDLMVRRSQRNVILHLSPEGMLQILGQGNESGQALEKLSASITGETLTVGYNIGYLLDGLKAAHRSDRVILKFSGSEGQTKILRPGTEDFHYMAMPVKIQQDAYSF